MLLYRLAEVTDGGIITSHYCMFGFYENILTFLYMFTGLLDYHTASPQLNCSAQASYGTGYPCELAK